MIKHIHVNDCDSTQDLLKEQLNGADDSALLLVSCESQLKGRGRGEKVWSAMPGTLCFSINIAPHPIMSFTAIELAVIVAKFFEAKKRTIKLKWPNDLWDEDLKKCGGILVQGNQSKLLAGLGINITSSDEQYGAVFSQHFSVDKKELSLELASYIHSHRFQDTEELKKEWYERCGHLNQMVTITENGVILEGIFQGLGEFGEALLCIDGKIHHLFNGTLRIS